MIYRVTIETTSKNGRWRRFKHMTSVVFASALTPEEIAEKIQLALPGEDVFCATVETENVL